MGSWLPHARHNIANPTIGPYKRIIIFAMCYCNNLRVLGRTIFVQASKKIAFLYSGNLSIGSWTAHPPRRAKTRYFLNRAVQGNHDFWDLLGPWSPLGFQGFLPGPSVCQCSSQRVLGRAIIFGGLKKKQNRIPVLCWKPIN